MWPQLGCGPRSCRYASSWYAYTACTGTPKCFTTSVCLWDPLLIGMCVLSSVYGISLCIAHSLSIFSNCSFMYSSNRSLLAPAGYNTVDFFFLIFSLLNCYFFIFLKHFVSYMDIAENEHIKLCCIVRYGCRFLITFSKYFSSWKIHYMKFSCFGGPRHFHCM